MIAEVYRALDRVSAKERVAWVLRHVQGESLEDTALLCECSLHGQAAHLGRARRGEEELGGGHGP